MDERDKRLLNLIQEGFPLVMRPFEALGLPLDLTEAEVLGRVADLKRQEIIRQIGGIFDTQSLGYKSSLV
ncbi:MAG TPA: Lrp/AsnC family transcriptional regulator, partial [Candidatus Methylomirabilis sp.]